MATNQTESEFEYSETEVTQACGCSADYHSADCPHFTLEYGAIGDNSTKEDWLEFYSRYDSMDDVPDMEGW